MHVFIAGIMQGSHRESVLHGQDYRTQLKAMLIQHLPDARIYDPLSDHRQSLDYDDDQGRQVFFHHNRMCRTVDLVVAFLPEASMGTAIEMWEAHEHGRGAVITISPLRHNWAVRFCSDGVFPDLVSFEAALASGEVLAKVNQVLVAKASRN